MKIYTHHDADGITAAVLFIHSKFEDIEDIEGVSFPQKFGEVDEVSEDDYIFDMRPQNPDIKCRVVDHHPDHPRKRKYNLIWANYPTSLIVYEMHQEALRKISWKCVVGLAGDGQPELVPSQIWDGWPDLLARKAYARDQFGKLSVSTYPIYMLLSSYINAFARLLRELEGLELLYSAKTPWDIIRSSEAERAKEDIRSETNKALKSASIEDYDNVVLIDYESLYRIGGILATRINEATKKTTIAWNRQTGTGNIRGVLSNFIIKKFKLEGAGHPGFAGFYAEEIDSLRRKLIHAL